MPLQNQKIATCTAQNSRTIWRGAQDNTDAHKHQRKNASNIQEPKQVHRVKGDVGDYVKLKFKVKVKAKKRRSKETKLKPIKIHANSIPRRQYSLLLQCCVPHSLDSALAFSQEKRSQLPRSVAAACQEPPRRRVSKPSNRQTLTRRPCN